MESVTSLHLSTLSPTSSIGDSNSSLAAGLPGPPGSVSAMNVGIVGREVAPAGGRPDDAERTRQRMDALRKHHNEANDRYSKAQHDINKQIHGETMEYLKNSHTNGTKGKSQKPRAPKRPRNNNSSLANNNNNIIISNNNNTNNNTNSNNNNNNDLQHQSQISQPINNHVYSPQQQKQQHSQYQTTTTHSQYIQSPFQQQPHSSAGGSGPQFRGWSSFQPNQHHFSNHQNLHQQPHSSAGGGGPHFRGWSSFRQNQHHLSNHQNLHHHQPLPTTLPNDLDFINFQAGLECDIDSLIKHEILVEGQLDFNHDLLKKLDNRNQQQPYL